MIHSDMATQHMMPTTLLFLSESLHKRQSPWRARRACDRQQAAAVSPPTRQRPAGQGPHAAHSLPRTRTTPATPTRTNATRAAHHHEAHGSGGEPPQPALRAQQRAQNKQSDTAEFSASTRRLTRQ